jgi:hypothetical protein
MRLVSFSQNGDRSLRSGIETAAGIADTESVAALAGFGEDARIALRSTRAPSRSRPSSETEAHCTAATTFDSGRRFPIRRRSSASA